MGKDKQAKRGRPPLPSEQKKYPTTFSLNNDLREKIKKIAEEMGKSEAYAKESLLIAGLEYMKLGMVPRIVSLLEEEMSCLKELYGIDVSHQRVLEAVLLNHLAMLDTMNIVFNTLPFVLPNFYWTVEGRLLEGTDLYDRFLSEYKKRFESFRDKMDGSMEEALPSAAAFN